MDFGGIDGWIPAFGEQMRISRQSLGMDWVLFFVLLFGGHAVPDGKPASRNGYFQLGRKIHLRDGEEPRVTETADGTVKLRYVLDVEKVRNSGKESHATGGLCVYARVPSADKVPEVRIGDRLRASGTVRLPLRYNNPGQIDTVLLLRCQGITAQLSAGKQGIQTEAVEGAAFLRKIAELRSYYLESMKQVMPSSDAAAIFAMLFGGYEGIREELLEADAGAANVLHFQNHKGQDVLVAANREVDQIVMFTFEDDGG